MLFESRAYTVFLSSSWAVVLAAGDVPAWVLSLLLVWRFCRLGYQLVKLDGSYLCYKEKTNPNLRTLAGKMLGLMLKYWRLLWIFLRLFGILLLSEQSLYCRVAWTHSWLDWKGFLHSSAGVSSPTLQVMIDEARTNTTGRTKHPKS